jgi:hypothetical protein
VALRPGYRQEYEDVFAMWVGLRAGVPTVNGYSGRDPDGWTLLAPDDADAALREWLTGKFRGRVRVIDRADPTRWRELVIE